MAVQPVPSPGPLVSEWRVEHLEEVDSTNRHVLDAARSGAAPGLVVSTSHQTKGRGRMDRQWVDEGRSLMFSVLLDPSCAPVATRAVALAVSDACRSLCQVSTCLKWPNDVLVGSAKLAGILAEADVSARGVSALVVGCGLNIDPSSHPGSACLADCGAAVEAEELLPVVLKALSKWLVSDVTSEFRRRCVTVGAEVKAELVGGGEVVGKALDVDRDGALILLDDGGATRSLTAGDVHHLRRLRPF